MRIYADISAQISPDISADTSEDIPADMCAYVSAHASTDTSADLFGTHVQLFGISLTLLSGTWPCICIHVHIYNTRPKEP